MNIYTPDIPIAYPPGETTFVSLKWLRGASRYNNGATRYDRKYRIRVIMGRAPGKKSKLQNS